MDDVQTQINNEIQSDVEEELPGLNIDVSDLCDPLEEELMNISW